MVKGIKGEEAVREAFGKLSEQNKRGAFVFCFGDDKGNISMGIWGYKRTLDLMLGDLKNCIKEDVDKKGFVNTNQQYSWIAGFDYMQEKEKKIKKEHR